MYIKRRVDIYQHVKSKGFDPTTPIFDQSKVRGRMRWLPIGIACFAVGGSSLLVALAFFGEREQTQVILLSLAAAWATLAPAWFFFEFHYWYRVAPGEDSWELFKHGQQVGTAVWAGVAATLYALGSSDIAKPPKNERECTIVLPTAGTSGVSGQATIKCPTK